MSPETVAALVGAGVGGAIAFVGQLGVTTFGARRERRAAAQMIYAELATNLTVVQTAVEMGDWPSTTTSPLRSAWDAYGVKLLQGRDLSRIAFIAGAYNRLDEIAWMWASEEGRPDAAETKEALRDVRLGLYEAGKVIGISDRKLEALSVLDDEVRRRRKELGG